MLGDDNRTRTPEGVFGAELRYHRERAGLSQTELAGLVNVSHDVISKIETGERAPARDFPERLDAVPQLDTRDGLARQPHREVLTGGVCLPRAFRRDGSGRACHHPPGDRLGRQPGSRRPGGVTRASSVCKRPPRSRGR